MFYTYILLCSDGSFYTGMTSNVKKRMAEHFAMNGKGAKYTRSHPPEKLAAVWQSADRSSACRLEYSIKQLTKQQKIRLVKENDLSVFAGRFSVNDYKRMDISNAAKFT